MFGAVTRFVGSRLWLRWTLITWAGFWAGLILGSVGGFLGVPLIGSPLSSIIRGCEGQGAIGCLLIGLTLGAGLGLGVAVGTAQWFVLRRTIPRSRWWILASTLGWCAVSYLLTSLAYAAPAPGSPEFGKPILENLPLALGAIAQVALAGGFMGLLQWLILRSTLRQSFWWIPANAIIALLAALGVFIQGYYIGGIPGVGAFMVGIFSPIYAVLSGIVFAWLVRNSSSQGVI